MWNDLANPERFDRLARPLSAACAAGAAALTALGLYFALFNSPADYQQGESVRIMYVHVPAAWLALAAYAFVAGASAFGFVFKHPLADVAAKSAAPIGAVFTALALVTGSLWGKPMWGTYWAWDARLTSVLILFFLYIGYMSIWAAIEDRARAARLAAIVAVAGLINIPVVKFSVDWWSSLHQPASVFRAGGPSIDGAMLVPLALMALGYTAFFAALLLATMRNELAARRLDRLMAASARPVSTLRME